MQSLQPFHTFNIPANAREIIEATSIEQIQQAWQKRKLKISCLIFRSRQQYAVFRRFSRDGDY